jgi:hypothetical protein
VCDILGISPGPAVKGILDRIIEWQLANPGLGVEECNVWLKEQADTGAFGDLTALRRLRMGKEVGRSVNCIEYALMRTGVHTKVCCMRFRAGRLQKWIHPYLLH